MLLRPLQRAVATERHGSIFIPGGHSLAADPASAAARVEEAIGRHSPASLRRDGTVVVYRGSWRAPSWNALGGSRGRVELGAQDGGLVARYRADFRPQRALLAVGAVLGSIWLVAGPAVLGGGPAYGAALLPPPLALALYAISTAQTVHRLESIVRKALARPEPDPRAA